MCETQTYTSRRVTSRETKPVESRLYVQRLKRQSKEMDETTTKRSPIITDTVKWNDTVTAPIIIPILIIVVFICIMILCIIKYCKKIWDKKTKSNAYEITDLIKTEKVYPSQLPVLDEEKEDHSNLNLLKYSDEDGIKDIKKNKKINRPPVSFPRKFRSSGRKHENGDKESDNNDNDGNISPNGRLQVEANVHDSSNSNNDLSIDMDEVPPRFDQTDNNASHFNHHGSELLRNAPTAATESEV